MIKINKKWFIDADKHGYILIKKVKAKNKNTGEEYVTDRQVGFHPTVSSALRQFIRLHQRKLTEETDMTLKEAIGKFEEIESIVLESCNKNII